MNLHIQSKTFSLTGALKQYVKRKVDSVIQQRADHIQRINVNLSDINGPHGGIDKRCQVHLVIPRMPDIVIQDTQANLYNAIDSAISRAKVALSRKLARRQVKSRYTRSAGIDQLQLTAS